MRHNCALTWAAVVEANRHASVARVRDGRKMNDSGSDAESNIAPGLSGELLMAPAIEEANASTDRGCSDKHGHVWPGSS